jgi:hydroxyacyl-ACP dehydratase HTD2-like protein with hotdog domain
MSSVLRVGDKLESLVRVPTTVSMFRFAAATWNTHRIHFDHHYATHVEDHEDLVVQMTLLGSYLAQLVQRAAGRDGKVRRLDFRALASAHPDRPVTCTGQVSDMRDVTGGAWVTIELALTQGSRVCLTGQACLELPRDQP